MKRLFAAIKIHPSADFVRILHELRHELRHEKIKWVESDNIHLTLKFFGETDEKQIPLIRQALDSACADIPAFSLKINRSGIFGSRYDPKVVWFGIDPEPGMSLLATRTESELQAAGWEPDRQNFVPHLTIGRIRELRDKTFFQQIIDTYKNVVIQEEMVTEVILYESILRREGPLYINLAAFPLKHG